MSTQQLQRRAVLRPSDNFTLKRIVPQWHAASISLRCSMTTLNLNQPALGKTPPAISAANTICERALGFSRTYRVDFWHAKARAVLSWKLLFLGWRQQPCEKLL
jgi:hypothetical protein